MASHAPTPRPARLVDYADLDERYRLMRARQETGEVFSFWHEDAKPLPWWTIAGLAAVLACVAVAVWGRW